MKKVVFKLEVNGHREQKKVMKTVPGLPGVEAIGMNMKEKKLTVIGDIDPVAITKLLMKLYMVQIVSVGPAKDPEKKKEEPKKDEKKKEEPKQDDRTCEGLQSL